MLIRCEKCGEVFPDDIGKCPRCKEPALPKPPPPQPQPTTDKQNTIVASIFVWCFVLAVLFFAVGIGLINVDVYVLGSIFVLLSIVCVIVTAGAAIKLKHMHDYNATTRKTTDVTPEEYEQRIRDFINHHCRS